MYYIVRFCGKLTFFLNCLYFNFFWRPKFFNFFLTFPNKFLTFGLTFWKFQKKKKCFEKSIFTVNLARDHREIMRAEQQFSTVFVSKCFENMIKNAKMSIRFFSGNFWKYRFSRCEPAKCKVIFAYPVSKRLEKNTSIN